MSMPAGFVIGVDVDVTSVGTDKAWIDWCKAESRIDIDYTKPIPYNLADVFVDVDPQYVGHFWLRDNVYDNIEPLEGSVEVLRELSVNNKIVFVSHVIGNHYASKKRFLDKHFPFNAGFIATDVKEYAAVDIMIDDRVDVLNAVVIEGSAVPVLFDSPYVQSQHKVVDYARMRSWDKHVVTNILETVIRNDRNY